MTRSRTNPRASAPPDHAFPYPWVRLRSATGHPLIYRRMVGDIDPTARPGDIVAVYDRSGQHLGHALYHDRSQIALRMISHDPEPIDASFFRARLEAAIAWRRRLFGEPAGTGTTDACRLFHAEGDGLSGLIAERYADTIVLEIFSLGVYRRIELFRRILSELTGVSRFVIRADERIQRMEGFRVDPDTSDRIPGQVTIRENGLRFRVDLRTGHKTGFFCDQRENRRRLASLCTGARVLDVCCYTGGFGLYAARLGHAAEVTGVDLDESAVALARKNAHLNDARIQHVHADAFTYLRQMQTNGRRFDVVVLDPPKFVTGREEQREGRIKYDDLNALGMSVVGPSGLLLTCSCSGLVSREDFRRLVIAAARRVGRRMQIVDESGAGPDHPVMANCPESAYLKALWCRLM